MSENKAAAWQALTGRAGERAALLGTEGLPTRRVEAWHYTPLQSLNGVAWQAAPALGEAHIKQSVAELDLPQHDGILVFANGQFCPALSHLPACMEVQEYGDGAAVPRLLTGRFSAGLNAALRQPGARLKVPAGRDAGLVIMVSLTEGEDVSTHLHHSVTLAKGAKLTLLDIQLGTGRYLTNPQMDVHCAEEAHFSHITHQKESPLAARLAIAGAKIEERGNYDSFTLNQGGALARQEVVSQLNGPFSNTNVNAIQLVDGERLNDLSSMIHHAAPDCTSRQTVRTVLSEQGQGVFQGKILVDPIAQKTDGYQMNQALLLSEKGQMNSKPELEIYADDVKCSHGATVGALDEEQLFYLRSRGVPEAQARDMLVQAFLLETVELVEHESLRHYLLKALPGHVG
ncbi:Fe-S cluster assembly protein SufD [Bombella saccharophila]|uniref:Fe-S cluster assembly protein SufD n=1 Tax=Bombella saccharophila TaxID=2967338 RepID=A0ABT3W9J7_9PROT|nr:Fe-S cluster assembly protein SufD [Bombella saccharophila]MCX5614308.1 Fe-S cluster assembly protein SufD [Bombella saccharophila]